MCNYFVSVSWQTLSFASAHADVVVVSGVTDSVFLTLFGTVFLLTTPTEVYFPMYTGWRVSSRIICLTLSCLKTYIVTETLL